MSIGIIYFTQGIPLHFYYMGDVVGWLWFLIPLGVGVVALREYRFAKACLAASGLLLAGKAFMELRDGSPGIGWRTLVVFIVCGVLGVLVQLSWRWVDRKRSEDEKGASTLSSKIISSQQVTRVTPRQTERTAPHLPQSGPNDALPGIRDSIGVMLNPGQRGIPKQLSFTTGGVGEQEFSFDANPTKVLFEPPMSVVEEKDLPKDIQVAGKQVTVRRFTDRGFVLDDHHIPVSGKAILLDAAPEKPKQGKEKPKPESRSDAPFARVELIGRNNAPQVQVTNTGAGARFYARLEINGPISGPTRDIFAKWAHTDTIKTRIARGDSCRLDIARLDWSRGMETCQWKIIAVRKDHDVVELPALYSSCAVTTPLVRADNIIVVVSIISEPDLENGIQKQQVVLTAFGARI